MSSDDAPVYASFFAAMGASAAIIFTCKLNISCFHIKCILLCNYYSKALGAAYGTAKSGTGIAAMAVMRPDLVIKSVIPVVMAGIIAIYGLVVAVLIANGCKLMCH